MLDFKATLYSLQNDLEHYLALYKEEYSDLAIEEQEDDSKVKAMGTLLEFVSKTLKGASPEETQLSNTACKTRLLLERYLNAQEHQSDLNAIEQELDGVETALEEWRQIRLTFDGKLFEEEWIAIGEIVAQARRRVDYLKKESIKIMVLFADYRKVAKDSSNPESIRLKNELEERIKACELHLETIQ